MDYYHIKVILSKPLDPIFRVALQAVLGSDLLKEMCSIKRIFDGESIPIRFFENKA